MECEYASAPVYHDLVWDQRLTCVHYSREDKMRFILWLKQGLKASSPNFLVTAGLVQAALFEAAIDLIKTSRYLSHGTSGSRSWRRLKIGESEPIMNAFATWWNELVKNIALAFRRDEVEEWRQHEAEISDKFIKLDALDLDRWSATAA